MILSFDYKPPCPSRMFRHHVTVGKNKKIVSAADANSFIDAVAVAFNTGSRALDIIQSWDEESRDWLDVDRLDEVTPGTKLNFVYSDEPTGSGYENKICIVIVPILGVGLFNGTPCGRRGISPPGGRKLC